MEHSSNLSAADEIIVKRILANQSVEGIIIANEQGQPQYTTLDNNVTFLINSKLLFLANKARQVVRDFDPTDNLITFRIRTRSKEMITVSPGDGMQVIAIQKVQSFLSGMQQLDEEFKDNV